MLSVIPPERTGQLLFPQTLVICLCEWSSVPKQRGLFFFFWHKQDDRISLWNSHHSHRGTLIKYLTLLATYANLRLQWVSPFISATSLENGNVDNISRAALSRIECVACYSTRKRKSRDALGSVLKCFNYLIIFLFSLSRPESEECRFQILILPTLLSTKAEPISHSHQGWIFKMVLPCAVSMAKMISHIYLHYFDNSMVAQAVPSFKQ